MVPLPVITYAHYRRVVQRYIEPAVHLHRDAATRRDLFRDLSERLTETYYRQPALVDDDDVAATQARARRRGAARASGTSRPWASRNSRARRRRLVPPMSTLGPRIVVVRLNARRLPPSGRVVEALQRQAHVHAADAVGGGKQGPDERDETLLKIREVGGIALRHRQGQPPLALQLGLPPELLHDERVVHRL